MRIVIELDEKIEGFKGADRFTREKLVADTLERISEEEGTTFETIMLVVENSECDTLVLDFKAGDIICRLR
jgi:hypothetical protein